MGGKRPKAERRDCTDSGHSLLSLYKRVRAEHALVNASSESAQRMVTGGRDEFFS